MTNLFPNSHFLDSASIIEYVRRVVNSNTVITEYTETGEQYDERGKYIEGNWYLERLFYMVPGHFHFVAIDNDWEDKIYRFSFLSHDNRLLRESEDQSYHKKIESICFNADKKVRAYELKNLAILPSDMTPTPWTKQDIEVIYSRVNNTIIRQIPRPIRQK